MRRFRNEFGDLATAFQAQVKAAVREHLDVVTGTLDILRSENVALESERDPEFRRRVGSELRRAREVMGRISAVVT